MNRCVLNERDLFGRVTRVTVTRTRMQNAASRVSRVAARGGAGTKPARPVVHLKVPTSAIPRDIRRVAEKAGVTGGYEGELTL